MISSNDGSFKLENVGKIYELSCMAYNLQELLNLFENIPNFRVISIKLKGLFHNGEIIEKDVSFESKGVYDCLNELTKFEIPVDELEVSGFQILWYDEVIM